MGSIGSGDESHHPQHQQQQLLLPSDLPKVQWGLENYYQYQGFWCTGELLKDVMEEQRDFQALDTDLILATFPKSGTTWLKSIAFAIVNRSRYGTSSSPEHNHPLLTTCGHALVLGIEYSKGVPITYDHQSPSRLVPFHVPYASLPESITNGTTNCKIVYLCRNPKDNFISLWHFLNKRDTENPVSIEEAFDLFCSGVSPFGPFWDHVLGYWKESLERPQKVLFLMYEDLKKDPRSEVKRLAEFSGYAFSEEEENEGVIDEVIQLCSFEHLRNLDINKNDMTTFKFDVSIFFRKGEVGDWRNYLTPPMAERLDRLIEEKFRGSGLVFRKSVD